jgi:teichuronic acid biosynthesis glycosyltransferase TuaC
MVDIAAILRGRTGSVLGAGPSDALPSRPMRLLVVTARYPTPDRPAAGGFVRDRLRDPALSATVVAPRHYTGLGWVRALELLWQAMTRRGRFDGVEGHFVLPSGPIALLAARIRGLPLVVFAHGSDVREMAHRNTAYRWLARRVVCGADGVIANSADTAAHVRELGADAVVIPPGVDLSRFSARPRPAERRVLYLGGAAASKGVEIARQLADTLVGPGLGEVNPDEIPALMASHDVVLVPSMAEGFGLVAAEAIAAGRWVVAAATGGLLDVVSEGTNGTLVTDGDFATALSRVPDYDPAVVAATAERFGIEGSRDAIREVWARVIRARGSAQEDGG